MDKKSKLGYSKGSPYRGNPYLDIHTPEGLIDMSNTDIPLYAQDETGFAKMLEPYSGMHQFNGQVVREVPMFKRGGRNPYMQQGGFQELVDFLFEEDEEEEELAAAPSTEEVDRGFNLEELEERERIVAEQEEYLSGMEAALVPHAERIIRERRQRTAGNPYLTDDDAIEIPGGAVIPNTGARIRPTVGAPPKDQLDIIAEAANKHGIPPEILAGVYGAETAYGRNVRPSSAGAQGPFQFMPATAKEMGVNPHDFNSAADGAARYLKNSYKQFGSWDKAVGAYNAGAGNIRKFMRTGKLPKETQDYIPKVLQNAEAMRGIFNR